MAGYLRNEVILVRYPYSDLTTVKVRPAVVVGEGHRAGDHIVVPITSRTGDLSVDEFVLADWAIAGLNVTSAVKRGLYTVHSTLVVKSIGQLSAADTKMLDSSLRTWLSLP